MVQKCKFSVKCENEDPKDPPIEYCAFSSNGEIVTCGGKQEDRMCCPFWSRLVRIQQD